MFFNIKRFFLFITLFSLLLGIFSPNFYNEVSVQNLKVLIDAGHGGKDMGTQGVTTKVLESDLNLEYSETLGNYFKQAGFKVIFTRTDKNSLSESGLGFHKKKDMEKRKEIIKNSKPDLFISIHMNEFLADKNQCGAQSFYQENDEIGKKLSGKIQESLNMVNIKNKICLAGDFFILKENAMPSVIVECGFLSNSEEEYLLQTKEHKEKICYAIFKGAMNYFYSNI